MPWRGEAVAEARASASCPVERAGHQQPLRGPQADGAHLRILDQERGHRCRPVRDRTRGLLDGIGDVGAPSPSPHLPSSSAPGAGRREVALFSGCGRSPAPSARRADEFVAFCSSACRSIVDVMRTRYRRPASRSAARSCPGRSVVDQCSCGRARFPGQLGGRARWQTAGSSARQLTTPRRSPSGDAVIMSPGPARTSAARSAPTSTFCMSAETTRSACRHGTAEIRHRIRTAGVPARCCPRRGRNSSAPDLHHPSCPTDAWARSTTQRVQPRSMSRASLVPPRSVRGWADPAPRPPCVKLRQFFDLPPRIRTLTACSTIRGSGSSAWRSACSSRGSGRGCPLARMPANEPWDARRRHCRPDSERSSWSWSRGARLGPSAMSSAASSAGSRCSWTRYPQLSAERRRTSWRGDDGSTGPEAASAVPLQRSREHKMIRASRRHREWLGWIRPWSASCTCGLMCAVAFPGSWPTRLWLIMPKAPASGSGAKTAVLRVSPGSGRGSRYRPTGLARLKHRSRG